MTPNERRYSDTRSNNSPQVAVLCQRFRFARFKMRTGAEAAQAMAEMMKIISVEGGMANMTRVWVV